MDKRYAFGLGHDEERNAGRMFIIGDDDFESHESFCIPVFPNLGIFVELGKSADCNAEGMSGLGFEETGPDHQIVAWG